MIRVLVVDDSAYVRKMLTFMLGQSPVIEVVGTARNGIEALEKVEALTPDVVTVDLQMPEMDGVDFVREQMRRRPVSIVVISIADEQTAAVLSALDMGAIDFLQKPTALANDRLLAMSEALIEKVQMAAAVPYAHIGRPLPARASASQALTCSLTRFQALVIGISTGGPQALKYLVPQFPAHFPLPIAIVMHMPLGYTALYAERLHELSQLRVKEAEEGDLFQPGTVLLAQAGRHLKLQRQSDNQVIAQLDMHPLDSLHRPSVDELFKSAANIYAAGVLGVVMTGMGNDGLIGAAAIKEQGGTVLTEAEESCIVYGMPRSIVEAGLSDDQASLVSMAQTIEKHL